MANVQQKEKCKYSFYEKYDDKLDVCFEFSVEEFEEYIKPGLDWQDSLGNEGRMTLEEYWQQDREIIDRDIRNFSLLTIQNAKP